MIYNDVIKIAAQKHDFEISKGHFPINSMRLYYLLMAQFLTKNNQECFEQINKAIPLIADCINDVQKGYAHKQSRYNIIPIYNSYTSSLKKLVDELELVNVRKEIDIIFTDLFHYQHQSLQAGLGPFPSPNFERVKKLLLNKLLTRNASSALYATVIENIIKKYIKDDSYKLYGLNPYHWQISKSMQINDLADAIYFQEEDSDKPHILIFILSEFTSNKDEIVSLVRGIFKILLFESTQVSFDGELQQVLNHWNNEIVKKVGVPLE